MRITQNNAFFFGSMLNALLIKDSNKGLTRAFLRILQQLGYDLPNAGFFEFAFISNVGGQGGPDYYGPAREAPLFKRDADYQLALLARAKYVEMKVFDSLIQRIVSKPEYFINMRFHFKLMYEIVRITPDCYSPDNKPFSFFNPVFEIQFPTYQEIEKLSNKEKLILIEILSDMCWLFRNGIYDPLQNAFNNETYIEMAHDELMELYKLQHVRPIHSMTLFGLC